LRDTHRICMERQRPRPTVGLVQVGSLIFVVIVAIWAAYLLQHWVRRREDAAATRSVDGFSKAMRVLEKRPLLPRSELRAPRPDSYAVKPAAAARAIVDVKRAVPAGAARSMSPLVARRASEQPADPLQVTRAAQVQLLSHPLQEINQQHPSDAHRGEVDPMPLSHNASTHDRAPQGHPRQGHGRPGERGQSDRRQSDRRHSHAGQTAAGQTAAGHQRPAPHRVSMAQRRLRAALLLLALLWLPVSIVLAITGVLLWVSVPFAFATLVAVLYWLRTEAEADRAHRAGSADQADSADRRARGAAPAPVLSSDDTQVISHRAVEEHRRAAQHQRGRRVRTPHTAQTAHAAQASHAAQAAPTGHTAQPAVASAAQVTAYDGVFDVQASETSGGPAHSAATTGSTGTTAATASTEAPGSWSPVPVPVPTYALKAKAEPRFTDDGIPADVFDTPEFAEEAEELDDRALFARRAVSG
jgi:hypothetical protein